MIGGVIVRKLTHQDFDQMVVFFDQMVQTSWLSSIHQQIASYLTGQSSLQVLDVGCGTGRFLQRIMAHIEQGVGIDLSPAMIKEAKKLASTLEDGERLSFLEGDAYELPFAKESFDVVISTCVLFLLPEPEKGIAEMSRVLKSQGMILTLNPTPEMNPEAALAYAQANRIPEHEWEFLKKWANVSTRKHRYSKDELLVLLKQHRFERVESISVLQGLAHVTRAYKQ